MAGYTNSENRALLEDAESSTVAGSQPGPLDWEVLSMSTMSGSTLGLPPQKPHETETKDRNFTDKAVSDASIDPSAEGMPHLGSSASEPETHLMDFYDLPKDEQHESMQALVGRPQEIPVAEEIYPVQGEGIPAISSKKKKIRVVWWRRQVFNWQPQSKKYSTVLSFAFVAAVVGIAVMGHRLYRERNLNHQLRLEVSSKEEKLNDMMYQVNRMKEAMTGRRRIGVSKGSFF